MPTGIRDRVAILGMGCTRFGERWESSADDLLAEAFLAAREDAGIGTDQIGAAWYGNAFDQLHLGKGGLPVSETLRLANVPVTRVENFCATGTEAFRGAVYAVAAGAVDIALAIGVEKLKDAGFGGLPPNTIGSLIYEMNPTISAPGAFAQLANAYQRKHRLERADLKRAMAHVSVKSHANAAKNPRAHLRKLLTEDQVMNAPMIAEPVGLFDCSGVSDGAACAIVTTPEIARSLGKSDIVTVKALQLSLSNGVEDRLNEWDHSYIKTTRMAAKRAYEEAGISRPHQQLSLTEVHDCFSITELVTMEDLFLSEEGRGLYDVLDGTFDSSGKIPCQIDGGLKCFGHPVGASGLRMIFELYLQLTGKAAIQLGSPSLGLTHNLGGTPSRNVASICIVGLDGA